jgi:hypothetical protein
MTHGGLCAMESAWALSTPMGSRCTACVIDEMMRNVLLFEDRIMYSIFRHKSHINTGLAQAM